MDHDPTQSYGEPENSSEIYSQDNPQPGCSTRARGKDASPTRKPGVLAELSRSHLPTNNNGGIELPEKSYRRRQNLQDGFTTHP